ncbi:concanavalin A-like lectin/glucanase domain-containing protein [Crepidotus variabilis]|uniref:Concanavalin A-like lectin/glucanase domain-containing protein n=1 Tax=Crepidotus variabilis TaxID=179855 RepID=A0A9P6E9V8_9AGAR|nr:concanavalin A-like lectin/glucanase domain-containing protein [Crepidotus variabilis]
MHSFTGLLALAASLPAFTSAVTFNLVDDYSGKTFFDNWDFYGNYDNLTNGDTTWVTKANATSKNLAEINSAGNAVLKVSTDTVVWNEKRDAVRITTQKAYPLGTIWITDVVHLPYGCSVWPAIWTLGQNTQNWPNDGEIDILEGINLNTNNQMALHTAPGCMHSTSVTQGGKSLQANCSVDAGCTVQDPDPKSYGNAFNQAGGGVWATQFTKETLVSIWFWSRANIPASVTKLASSKDAITSQDDWGTPTANYPGGSDCDLTKSFTAQKLVYDITLCGTWGGNPDFYLPQCSAQGPTTGAAACYTDNVVGNGSNYANAYFEIKYLRAYIDPSAPAVPGQNTSSSGGSSSSNSSASGSSGKAGAGVAAAPPITMAFLSSVAAIVIGAAFASLL